MITLNDSFAPRRESSHGKSTSTRLRICYPRASHNCLRHHSQSSLRVDVALARLTQGLLDAQHGRHQQRSASESLHQQLLSLILASCSTLVYSALPAHLSHSGAQPSLQIASTPSVYNGRQATSSHVASSLYNNASSLYILVSA